MKKITVITALFVAQAQALTTTECQDEYKRAYAAAINPAIESPGVALRDAENAIATCVRLANEQSGTKVWKGSYRVFTFEKGKSTTRVISAEESEALDIERLRKNAEVQVRRENERQASVVKQLKRQEDMEIASKEREQKAKEEAEYKASPKYRREEAIRQISFGKAIIRSAYEAMDEERRIAKISGYENKYRMHENATRIVAAERVNAEQLRIIREIDEKK